jgi:general secretion pathway protein G
MDKKRARAQGEVGFTLVELLVVIVILGVLAAIVVFAVGGITDKGQTSACKADKSSIETAEEAYFANQKTSPTYGSMDQLVAGKFLHEASTLHTVDATAGSSYTVSPASGSGCSA